MTFVPRSLVLNSRVQKKKKIAQEFVPWSVVREIAVAVRRWKRI